MHTYKTTAPTVEKNTSLGQTTRPRRQFAPLLVVGVGLLFEGCSSSGVSRVPELLGFTDPTVPMVVADFICDSSSQACTSERLQSGLSWGLEDVAELYNIKVRLFGLGDDLGSTKLLAEVTSTSPASTAPAVVKAYQQQFRAKAREQLRVAALPLWQSRHRASPIAEALAAVARYPASDKRIIVLLSDLRQESGGLNEGMGHFECETLPSVPAWTERTKKLFSPLRGTAVLVSFASPLEPVAGGRCTFSAERYEEVVALWTGALTARGAKVIVSADAISQPLSSFLEVHQ